MDADSRISLLSVFILLFFAAFFAVSETALASVSQNKLKVAADRGDDRAVRALDVTDNIETAISTLLILTNIVHISVATIVTVMVTKLWGLGFVSISTIITTIVVFFVGEMLPKSIAKKESREICPTCSRAYLHYDENFRTAGGDFDEDRAFRSKPDERRA